MDIDDLKRARDFAEAVVATVREPMLVLDAGLRVRTANRRSMGCFKWKAGTPKGA